MTVFISSLVPNIEELLCSQMDVFDSVIHLRLHRKLAVAMQALFQICLNEHKAG